MKTFDVNIYIGDKVTRRHSFKATDFHQACAMARQIPDYEQHTAMDICERTPLNTLLHMRVLSLLFCNYTHTDIEHLCTDPGFAYFWHNKLTYFDEHNTEKALWLAYSRYMDQSTMLFVLNHAMARYEAEARRWFDA